MTRVPNKLTSIDMRAKSILVISGIFAQYGILFVTGILVARFLGPELLGRYQLGISITAVLSVFAQLGFNQGIVKFVPFFRKRKQFSEVNRIMRASFTISGMVALSIAILLVGFSEFFSILFFHDLSMKGIVRYSGLYLIVYNSTQLIVAFFDSYEKQIIQTLVYKFGGSLLFLGALIYLIFFRFSDSETLLLYRIIVDLVVMLCLVFIWKFWINERSVDPQNNDCHFHIKDLVGFSFPLLLSNAIQVLIMNIDILMIGWFMTANDVGVYTIYVMISRIGLLVLTAMNSIIAPMISGCQSDADAIQQYERILKGSTRLLAWISANILLLTIMFSDQILGLLGTEYLSDQIVLWILTLGTFIHLASGPTGTFLVMSGNQKVELGNSVFLMISNIVLNAVFIPFYGIVGAAIATTISIALNKTGKTIQVFKLFRIFPFDFSIAKRILVLTILLAVYFAIHMQTFDSNLLYPWILVIILAIMNIDVIKLCLSRCIYMGK